MTPSLDLSIRIACAFCFVCIVFGTGVRIGRHIERLRLAAAFERMSAQETLRASAAEFRRASAYQGAALRLVSNRERDS